jgi:hypothetical protein
MATWRRDDDAVTTTPDRHGHLCRPLGMLECGVGGLGLCLWDVYVECVVVSYDVALVVCVAVSYACSLYQIT